MVTKEMLKNALTQLGVEKGMGCAYLNLSG